MAILALPPLLGCNCCDALALPDDPRPVFTAEQVVGVWNSTCGGKLSIAEGGTYRAQGLLADSWDDGHVTTEAVTGTGLVPPRPLSPGPVSRGSCCGTAGPRRAQTPP